MLGTRAVIHAQPRRPFPSKGPREAKGGGLPDRHRGNLCVAAGRRCWGACDPWPDQRTDAMPTNKDFKRLVRARMQKTGEAYTAARAHLLQKQQESRPVDYARLAGMMSDAALKARTGCTWEHRPLRAREVQGAGLVGPDCHRGLRADQGPARHRAASWRGLRGDPEQDVRGAAVAAVPRGRSGERRVGEERRSRWGPD